MNQTSSMTKQQMPAALAAGLSGLLALWLASEPFGLLAALMYGAGLAGLIWIALSMMLGARAGNPSDK